MKKTIVISSVIAVVAAISAIAMEPQQKVRYAMTAIDRLYVDSVDEQKLAETAIVSMLKELDPHSLYSDPEETRELNEPLQGNFSGIGIQFNMSTDSVYVIQVIPQGPSEKAGLLPGDRIIAADDSIISGVKMKNSEVMKHLRGPKGSKVKLTVVRKGSEKPIDFIVTRDNIPINSVDAVYMAAPSVGYIKLSRFAEKSGDEIREAIRTLKKQGMKDLILDLQDNGGGYLQAAVEIAEMVLPQNSMIVYTNGDKTRRTDYRSESKPIVDGRVAVLVNQYSASASEILSGAVQDHDRGVIVGRRTFGKGLVQRPIPFPDGSMMRLTVARYYTPSGRCIQKPYKAGEEEEYQADILHRLKSGELTSADSIHLDMSEKFSTDDGRTVYGGGGIMPDYFVPIDTTFYSDYYRDLSAKGIFPRYTQEYIDQNRQKVKKLYKKDTDFAERFEVTPDMIERFKEVAASEGIEFKPDQFEKSRDVILFNIKGLIGRDIYEQSTYYMVANPHNDIFTRALEIITSPEYDSLLTPKK